MKYLSIVLSIALVGASGYWFFIREDNVIEAPIPKESQATTTTESKTSQISSTTPVHVSVGNKTYENKTWGIRFEYPKDWVALESTFRAASSLFNVVLQPDQNNLLPRPLFVNLVTNDWGQTLYSRALENGNFREVTIAGQKGITYASTDMGLPTEVFLFQVDLGFWITIIGKEDYVSVLDQVLESLVITPVKVQTDQ